MPEAAPVTNAVLPSRSLMPTRSCKKVSPGRYRAKRLRAERRRSPAHFGKENAALRLGGRLRFHDFDHHRFGRNGEVLHHRIGDVLDQRALLIERAALDGVHVNFRHIGLPLCASHRGTIPTAQNIGRRTRGPSAEEAESALTGISATPIIPLTITQAEGALARVSAAAIITLAITPRGILGAYLAPPNGIGSGWLAPALMAACGFLRLLGRGRGPRRRLGRDRHLGGRCRRRFGRVRLGTARQTRRGGRRLGYALRRGDAADRNRSNWRAIRFDAGRAWLARDAAITFAAEIGPGSMERCRARSHS